MNRELSLGVAILGLAAFVLPAGAQQGHLGAERSYAPLVEKVAPAIVSVYAFGNDALIIGQAPGLQHAAGIQGDRDLSFGSGVIVDPPAGSYGTRGGLIKWNAEDRWRPDQRSSLGDRSLPSVYI